MLLAWFQARLRKIWRSFNLIASWLASALRSSSSLQDVHTILIIRLQHLGDVLMTLPAAARLQQAHPKAQISWLVSSHSKPLLANQSFVHEIIEYNSRRYFPLKNKGFFSTWLLFWRIATRHFDLIIDFDGDFWTLALALAGNWKQRADRGTFRFRYRKLPRKLKQIEVNLKLLEQVGVMAKPEDLQIRLPAVFTQPQSVLRVRQSLGFSSQDRLVAVHPAAGLALRQWPVEWFAQICAWLVEQYQVQVVLVGSPGEAALSQRILERTSSGVHSAVGRLPMEDLLAFMGTCQCFLGGDSFPAHVAAVCGIPTLVLYGPQDPDVFALPYPNVHVLYKKVFCSPCIYNNMYVDYCPRKIVCMTSIIVAEVEASLRQLLTPAAKSSPKG